MTYTVLFVCVENSCRSQIAEAILNHLAESRGLPVRATSAGTKPSNKVNPLALKVLHEIGLDTDGLRPKPLTNEMIEKSDSIVTMGCLARYLCPAIFLSKTEDWDIEDPAGSPIKEFREVSDKIRRRVERLLSEISTPEGTAARN
jgi:arsenate reductase